MGVTMSDETIAADLEGSYFTDPAHLFMQLYDRLPDRLFLGRDAINWRAEREVIKRANAIAELVLDEGAAEYKKLLELVDGEDHRARFTILLGLDMALQFANPFSGAHQQYGVTKIARRYAETGLFNDPAVVPGALLPRCAIAGGPIGRGHKEDFFAVHVVPAETLSGDRVRLRQMPPRYQFSFPAGEPVKVACAPLLTSYQELGLTLDRANGVPTYRIAPAGIDDLDDRIARIVDAMDAAGARIGVMPEGCLSETILDQWRRTLPRTDGPDKPLRWLLLGSGPVSSARPPHNRAVLLDRGTGEVLLTHDKLERFTITDEQARDWRLPWPPQGCPVEEDITRGRSLDVLETLLGRLIAVICEDLNGSMAWDREAGACGVSHLFSPIFSKPILRYRWEHQAAERQVRHLGAWVVVSNSLAVATALADPSVTEDTGGPEEGYTCLTFGPAETRRRARYAIATQFGRSRSADDLGWLADADQPNSLPVILPGVLYAEWFGGGPPAA